MGFSRQEYWGRLPCPPPGDFPNPGIKPRSPALQADSLQSKPPRKPKNTGVGSLPLSPGVLPNPGIKSGTPALQVDSLLAELPRLVRYKNNPSPLLFSDTMLAFLKAATVIHSIRASCFFTLNKTPQMPFL